MEEHVPCHCRMHPSPVTLCASPAACGAGCQEGMTGRSRTEGVEDVTEGVEDVTQDGGRGGGGLCVWKGGKRQEGLGS